MCSAFRILGKEYGKMYDIPYSTWALGSDIWSFRNIPFVKDILKRVLKESQIGFADGYLRKNDGPFL